VEDLIFVLVTHLKACDIRTAFYSISNFL